MAVKVTENTVEALADSLLVRYETRLFRETGCYLDFNERKVYFWTIRSILENKGYAAAEKFVDTANISWM